MVARTTGLLLVCLVSLLELGLNPFGSFEANRPWSVCGQDLCLCTPAGPAVTPGPAPEAFCPLCPGYGAEQTDREPRHGDPRCDEGCDAPATPRLVRRAERLDIDLPLLSELIGATLVVRLGTPPVHIEAPACCGLVLENTVGVPEFATPAMDPPPPRAA